MKKSRKRLIAWMLAAVMALTCGSGAAFADEVQTEGEGAAGEAVNVEAEQPEVNLAGEGSGDGEKQAEETDNARLGAEGEEEGYYGYEIVFDSENEYPMLFDGESLTVYAQPYEDSDALPEGYSLSWEVGISDEEVNNITPVDGVEYTEAENGQYEGITISAAKGCFDEVTYVDLTVVARILNAENNEVGSYCNFFGGRSSKAIYYLPEDMEILVSETDNIDESVYGYVCNSDYPEGIDITTKIDGLTASDAGIVDISYSDGMWNLRALKEGTTELIAKYKDNNSVECEHRFNLTVSDTVYYSYEERSIDDVYVFPGETVSYTTSLSCGTYDTDNEEIIYKDITDYSVSWEIVQTDYANGEETEINHYRITQSENGKKIDLSIDKSSPESELIIKPIYHVGGETIEISENYLYVKKEILTGNITDNYGYNEPALPGDSADYTFKVSWKKFDKKTGKVIDMDTSKVKTTWQVELYDEYFNEDITHALSDYVSHKQDAVKPNILHVKINNEWVDEDVNVKIIATASTGDEDISTEAYKWINLKKEIYTYETAEYFAAAGDEISINDLKPRAKKYNEENPQGIEEEEYDFAFSNDYYSEIKDGSLPLEGATVSDDGKTLKIPKVQDGRYVVGINANSETESTVFYAPIYVGNGVFKLSTTNYTYNGKVQTPSISVTDVKGNTVQPSNYTVSYSSGRKSVGTYKVTVKFNGDLYGGSGSAYFNINPKGTSISKVSKAKKAFTVKWKRQSANMATSRITGYQIRYSTSSKMTGAKSKTVKGYKYTSKKITKLKAKKKYYVQIRTYKTVSGKNYYSSWSKVKSVTTR